LTKNYRAVAVVDAVVVDDVAVVAVVYQNTSMETDCSIKYRMSVYSQFDWIRTVIRCLSNFVVFINSKHQGQSRHFLRNATFTFNLPL